MPQIESKRSQGVPSIKFGSSLNLSAIKRSKSYAPLDQEAIESKKGRLIELLQQQYTSKYGVRKEHSPVNQAIKSAIKSFVDNASDLFDVSQSANNGELDAFIKNVASKAKGGNSYQKKGSQKSSSGETRARSESNSRKDLQLPLEKIELNPLNPWAVLSAIEKVAEEKEKLKEIQDKQEKAMKFKSELDRQKHEHDELIERARKEKEQLLQQTTMSSKKFQEEMEAAKVAQLKHFEVEREIRLKQMEERQSQRQREREARIREERAEMEAARRVLEEEERARREAKEAMRTQNERMLMENERLRVSKLEEVKRARELEHQMMQEYSAKLEREEKDRAAAFQGRIATLNRIAHMHHETVGSKEASAEAERERKLRLAVERKAVEEADREAKRKERQRILSKQALADNQQLIQQKTLDRERQRAEDLRLKERFERELEEGRRKEEAEERRKREAADALRAEQERQMQERSRGKRSSGKPAAEEELVLNQLLKKKIEEDPELYKRAVDKVLTMTQRNEGRKATKI